MLDIHIQAELYWLRSQEQHEQYFALLKESGAPIEIGLDKDGNWVRATGDFGAWLEDALSEVTPELYEQLVEIWTAQGRA